MRRTLLASAAATILAFGLAPMAQAQGVPVIDALSIAQAVANEVQTIAHMVEEYQLLEQQYQEMTLTFNALSHGNNVLSVAPGLLSRAAQLPGSAASAIPGLAFGSTLSGSGASFYAQNHYYTPQGTDFETTEIQRRQQATANIQGEAQTGMQEADARIASLQALQANIQVQPDVTALAAAQAHINAEQAFLSNEQAKIQRLALMEQVQDHVDAQRAEEAGRRDADQWHAFAAGAAFGE